MADLSQMRTNLQLNASASARWLPTLMLALFVVACGGQEAEEDCGVAGQSVACACVGGATGAQVCLESGVFGDCACRDEGEDVTDATSEDADTGTDLGEDVPVDTDLVDADTGDDASDVDDTDASDCDGGNVNACGGCEVLEGDLGSACGACGTLQCDGADALSCADAGLNACGACGDLAVEPGTDCSTCGIGAAYACDEAGESVTCEPTGDVACEPASCEPGTICALIDADGGDLEVDGVQVVAEPGAVPTEHVFLLRSTAEATVGVGYRQLSAPVSLEVYPDRGAFEAPVTVALPYEGEDPSTVVFWSSRPGPRFERRGGVGVAGSVVSTIPSAGFGFAGDGIDFFAPVDASCARTSILEGRVTDPSAVALWFSADDCNATPLTGLVAEDFVVLEDGEALTSESVATILPRDGLQVFVTLVVDMSDSALPSLPQVVEAAQAMVDRLREVEDLPVQIAVEVFAGNEQTFVWQRPTLDPDALSASLSDLATFVTTPNRLIDGQLLDYSATNLNGALADAFSRQRSDREAFETRNRGGGITAGAVVVFSDGRDTAGRATVADVASANVDRPAELWAVLLESPDLDVASLTDGLGAETLVAPTTAVLEREFETVAVRLAGRISRTYLLGYCSPLRAGEHTVGVGVAGAVDGDIASFQFSAAGFGPGCGVQTFEEACIDVECGGLGCGICDDREAVCAESGRCVDLCEAERVCGDRLLTTAQGYQLRCPDVVPSRVLCPETETCVDHTTDALNCGECGVVCSDLSGCEAGACLCGNGELDGAEQCDDGGANADEADTCRTDCRTPLCGDGIIDSGEQCDDGNLVDSDACRNVCTSPVCGDGVVSAGEECDDGNDIEDDACNSACESPLCGNGVVDEGEQCDSGESVGTDCLDTCVRTVCGDGIVTGTLISSTVDNFEYNPRAFDLRFVGPGWEVDDTEGWDSPSSFRSADIDDNEASAFVIEVVAGADASVSFYALIESELSYDRLRFFVDDRQVLVVSSGGWQFHTFPLSAGSRTLRWEYSKDGSSTVGRDSAWVDDLRIEGRRDAEQCDDGVDNADAPDSCRLDCRLPRCGDGIVDEGEVCDDGNAWSSDECMPACTLAVCGDGFVSEGEECDDGNDDETDACLASCRIPSCGDGTAQTFIVPPLEDVSFDDGYLPETLTFSGPEWRVSSGPDFDGGLAFESGQIGDSESSGFSILVDSREGAPLTFSARVDAEPTYDKLVFYVDGEVVEEVTSGDWQSYTFDIESGERLLAWHFEKDASRSNGLDAAWVDTILFGDPATTYLEECDDGAANSNAPDACRLNCQLPTCGDAVVDTGETCDDGNLLDGDGCLSTCAEAVCGDGLLSESEQCDDGNGDDTDACPGTCELPYCGDGFVSDFVLQERESVSFHDGEMPPDFVFDGPEWWVVAADEFDGGFAIRTELTGLTPYSEFGFTMDAAFASTLSFDARVDSVRCCDRLQLYIDDILYESITDTEGELATYSYPVQPGSHEFRWRFDDNSANAVAPTIAWVDNILLESEPRPYAEECDDGIANGTLPDGCSDLCEVPRCGDGIVSSTEECDDGNLLWNDGCGPECELEFCGDDRRQSWEWCDDGVLNGTEESDCRVDCAEPRCGDGFLDPVESNLAPDFDQGHFWRDASGDWEIVEGQLAHSGSSALRSPDIGDNEVSRQSIVVPGDTRRSLSFWYLVSAEACCDGMRVYIDGTAVADLSADPEWQQDAFILDAGPATVVFEYYKDRSVSTGFDAAFLDTFKVLGMEQCDDSEGLGEGADQCRWGCELPVCGDEVVDSDEECDVGPEPAPYQCTVDCRTPVCGDGVVAADPNMETFDETRGTWFGDGWTWRLRDSEGRLEATSNRNRREATREVELFGASTLSFDAGVDGPSVYAGINVYADSQRVFRVEGDWPQGRYDVQLDASVSEVTFEVDYGEELDAGLPLFWVDNVSVVPFGTVIEVCDEGAANADGEGATCRSNCRAPGCGDGVLDDGEDCDDGNRQGGDGCSQWCTIEVCGNGRVEGAEQCDDGNENDADGCGNDCVAAVCGDGVLEGDSRFVLDVDSEAGDEIPAQFVDDDGAWVVAVDSENRRYWAPADMGPNARREMAMTVSLERAAIVRVGALGVFTANSLSFSVDGVAQESWRNSTVRSGSQSYYLEAGEYELQWVARSYSSGWTTGGARLIQVEYVDAHVEECDDGELNSDAPGACRADCTLPYCGDGMPDPGEECDAATLYTECSDECALPYCGNGVTQRSVSVIEFEDEEDLNTVTVVEGDDWTLTDDGLSGSGALSPPLTTNEPIVIHLPTFAEGVASGALYSRTNNAAAVVEVRVGSVDRSQPVFPGGSWNSQTVLAVPIDGVPAPIVVTVELLNEPVGETRVVLDQIFMRSREHYEECDAGAENGSAPDACRTTCELAGCGDGVTDSDEGCDDGPENTNFAGACRRTCELPTCGDGIIDANEECDDGNVIDGDSCSSVCELPLCTDVETLGGTRVLSFEDELMPQEFYGVTGDSWGFTSADSSHEATSLQVGARGSGAEISFDVELAHPGEFSVDLRSDTNASVRTVINGAAQSAIARSEWETFRREIGPGFYTITLSVSSSRPDPVMFDRMQVTGLAAHSEYCDDGDLTDDEPCSPRCTTVVCGDGVAHPGEECDDGNEDETDACTSDCRTAICGDGVPNRSFVLPRPLSFHPDDPLVGISQGSNPWSRVSGAEFEDGWAFRSADIGNNGRSEFSLAVDVTRAVNVSMRSRVDAELCCDVLAVEVDDTEVRTVRSGDWQDVSFVLDPGEHTVTFAYRKDVSTSAGSDAAWVDSLVFELASGSEVEECDDGAANASVADACRPNCLLPTCGDGVVDSDEGCDDGDLNRDDANSCRSNCALPTCGDGIQDASEECDDGNITSGDTCTPDCRTPLCGDGVLNASRPPPAALDFAPGGPPEPIVQGGNPWIAVAGVDFEDGWAFQSADIDDGERSEFALVLDVVDALDVTIRTRVDAEPCCDRLEIDLDGGAVTRVGNGDWQDVTFRLAPGERSLNFAFVKDGSLSTGSDAAWVDEISFEFVDPPDVEQCDDGNVVDGDGCSATCMTE